jgi:hypothetical protein
MVVVPTSHDVTLTYGRSTADDLGLLLTLLAAAAAIVLVVVDRRARRARRASRALVPASGPGTRP